MFYLIPLPSLFLFKKCGELAVISVTDIRQFIKRLPSTKNNFFTFLFLLISETINVLMPCGVGHITKNSTNVFSACRKRRLKETGQGDWESPPL